MKRADRDLALKAARMYGAQAGDFPEVARRLRRDVESARVIVNRGLLIEQCERLRLTDNEMLVMKTLARVEARRIHLGEKVSKANAVDYAAGKRSGWTYSIVKKRLFDGDIPFVIYTTNGHIWLTASGWAFVWATGLVLKNWKVPT